MIGLSASTLSLFKNCARCFWLEKIKKLKRPEGIKASIMSGLDREMKNSVEQAVLHNQPHVYLAEIEGAQPFSDRAKLKKMQNWKTFQVQVGGILLWGGLDDLVSYPETGTVAPWDFKSNGKERAWSEYAAEYYQTQGDTYHVLLEGSGFVAAGHSLFTFSWPSGFEPGGNIVFRHQTISLPTDPKRVLGLAQEAMDCLNSPEPAPSATCEYCHYVEVRR